MSLEVRRTEMVLGVIQELFAGGKKSVRPGDVSSVLRERSTPLGSWEIRNEFSALEADNRIHCDPDTGDWFLTDDTSLKDAG